MRRFAALALLVAVTALVGLGGCAKSKVVAIENLPPETTLFVQGDLDTVNHVVQIHWFGSDPDGEVTGYEVRLVFPGQPADAVPWVFTTRTDSTLTVFTPAGYAKPTFEVRSIDNSSVRDPSPARVDFQFSNQSPTVRFIARLATNDTTYASVTLDWIAVDPDGDHGALRFQVGLDTVASALHLVAGNRFTVDTTDFKEGGVYPETKPRMAFIRAIDDGGRMSVWDSVRWVVRAPSAPGVHPKLLLIDDVTGNTLHDNVYRSTVNAKLPPGSFSVLRMEFTFTPGQPNRTFRSEKDVLQTFRQFDTVIWYRGTEGQAVGGAAPTFSPVMHDYQDALAAYVDGGGKLMIESLNLVEGENAVGALDHDWTERYLGSRDLILAYRGDAFGDSSVAWSIAPGYTDTLPEPDVIYRTDLHSTVFLDSLRNNINTNGLRGFAVVDTGVVALWARENDLSPRVDRDIPIGVTVPVAGSPAGAGRVIVFTTPIGGATGFGLPAAQRFLCKVLLQMGLSTSCP